MKNYVVKAVAVLSFLVIFGAVSTNAQQSRCVTAQIPFTFTAMNRVFAEGNYKICPESTLSTLFSLDNGSDKSFGLFNPLAIDWRDADKSQRLVFKRYGDSHFLSEIRTLCLALELKPSKAEKELRRGFSSKHARPSTVTVALSPARGKTKS